MSENVQKLVGGVVMAVLVVVGVAVSSGDDTDFSRNRSFSSAAETFAGADRLEDPDCCDQNAYEILKLETQLAEMNNKVASLDAELDELQQLQPLVVSFLNAFPPGQDSPLLKEAAKTIYNTCEFGLMPSNYPNPDYFVYQAACYREALVGLDLGFAKALIATDVNPLQPAMGMKPKFAVFHRFSKASYASPSIITTEACAPIFMNGHTYVLALDTVAGVVGSQELHFFKWFPVSQNWTGEGSVYVAGEWEEWVNDNDLCE